MVRTRKQREAAPTPDKASQQEEKPRQKKKSSKGGLTSYLNSSTLATCAAVAYVAFAYRNFRERWHEEAAQEMLLRLFERVLAPNPDAKRPKARKVLVTFEHGPKPLRITLRKEMTTIHIVMICCVVLFTLLAYMCLGQLEYRRQQAYLNKLPHNRLPIGRDRTRRFQARRELQGSGGFWGDGC